MFDFKLEKASGYILETFSCFFLLMFVFDLFCFFHYVLTTYAAVLARGGGKYSQSSFKKSNRRQCISFIFTYIEGTLSGVDIIFHTKDFFHNAKPTFYVHIKYNL
jgi:hypothetical protein